MCENNNEYDRLYPMQVHNISLHVDSGFFPLFLGVGKILVMDLMGLDMGKILSLLKVSF